MDGSNFKGIELSGQVSSLNVPETSQGRQKRISSLISTQVNPEAVELTVDNSSKSKATNEARSMANSIISTINLAKEATSELGALCKSVSGIAEQASQKGITPERREILEQEANNLSKEIRLKSNNSAKTIEPIVTDKVKAEIEEKLGNTLEQLLPQENEEAFNLGEVKLNMREGIVNILTSVAKAQQRLNQLNDVIQNADTQVQSLVDEYDVAAQNSEASSASIRDVNDAVKVVSHTKHLIEQSPKTALQSAGVLNHNTVDILVDNNEGM